MRMAHVVPLLPGRVEVKYSVLPSSDQRGAVLSNAGAVMRRDGPPESDWIQTSEWRAFLSSRTLVTVNARVFPSGDSVPPPGRRILYQSSGWKARPVDCAASAVAVNETTASARAKVVFIGSLATVWGRRVVNWGRNHTKVRAGMAARWTHPGAPTGSAMPDRQASRRL